MIQSKFPSRTTNLIEYGRNSLILVLYYYKSCLLYTSVPLTVVPEEDLVEEPPDDPLEEPPVLLRIGCT